MFVDLPPPPLSLYVHVPWCVRKCHYCDFNSHPVGGEIPAGRYIAALVADLEGELPDVWGRRIATIFIGGGTPSLLPPEEIERLLDSIRALLPFGPETEVTMEANPGTAEAGRFRGYRAAGVNRLSIGVQGFDDRLLARIGRIHTGDEAAAAVAMARDAGFERINLDLMFGQPGQRPAGCRDDVARAVALGPDHISFYQFTLEPGTPFFRRPPAGLPDDDTLALMQEEGSGLLALAGYEQYEVSAWARPGRRCRHNLNYWAFGDYLGIGAGAHGKLSFPGRGIVRRHKERLPERYMEAAVAGGARAGEERLRPEETVVEFMMNALRLREGFAADLFHRHTGLDPALLEPGLTAAREGGLIDGASDHIRPTATGWRFLDDLVGLFLPLR